MMPPPQAGLTDARGHDPVTLESFIGRHSPQMRDRGLSGALALAGRTLTLDKS